MKRKWGIFSIVFSSFLLVIIFASLTYSSVLYRNKKRLLMNQTNEKLKIAATMARDIAGDDYHDNIFDEDSVSEAEYESIVDKYSTLCNKLGLQYLWSVLVLDNDVYFTTATRVSPDNPNSEFAGFFSLHSDPQAFIDAINGFVPVYSSFHNEWGEGRMVLLPFNDKLGRRYIFGASIQLLELEWLINYTVIDVIKRFVFVVLFAVILAFLLTRAIIKPIKKIIDSSKQLGAGEFEEPFSSYNVKELDLLSTSLNHARLNLHKSIMKLEESHSELKTTLQSIGDGVLVTDKDGVITMINPIAEKMTGWKEEEAIGKELNDVFHIVNEDSREEVENPALLALNKGIIVGLANHTLLIAKDGSEIPISDSAAPIFDTEHNVSGVILVFSDQSRERELLNELRESEATVRNKLNTILDPEGDISQLQLQDIIDLETLQNLIDRIYELTEVPISIIDIKGKILVTSGFQDICADFHRKHKITRQFCVESDTELTKGLKSDEYRVYKCKNNMWDVSTPIIVGGHHFGNIFSGQFFFENEEIDYEFFKKQAYKYGFDRDEYLKALEKVPRFSKNKVEQAIRFFADFAVLLSNLSASNIKNTAFVAEKESLIEVIKKNEEKYRNLIDNIFGGVFILNCDDLTFSYTNSRFREVTGFVEEEINHSDFEILSLFKAEGISLFRSKLALITESKSERESFEINITDKEGTDKIIEIKLSCIDEHNKRKVLGIILDVTERKTIENKVLLQKEQFSRIFDLLPNWLFVRDINGKYLVVNRAYEKAFGRSAKEIIGKTDSEMGVTAVALKKYLAQDKLVIDSGEQLIIPKEKIDRGDGTYGWFQTVKIPYYQIDSKQAAVLTITVDITDKIEDNLKMEELFHISTNFMKLQPAQVNYQEIADFMIKLTDGLYSSLNIYNSNTDKVVTVAVSGDPEEIAKSAAIIGFPHIDREWDLWYDWMKDKNQIINKVDDSGQFLRDVFSDDIAKMIETQHSIGDIYIINIMRNEAMIGNITLIMPKGKKLSNKNIIEIYTQLLSLLLSRKMVEKDLLESEIKQRLLVRSHRQLSNLAIFLTEANSIEKIETAIMESLMKLLKADLVVISRYNDYTKQFTMNDYIVSSSANKEMGNMMKLYKKSLNMKVDESVKEMMIKYVISRPATITELTWGEIPLDLSNAIIKKYKISGIVALSLNYGNEMFGSVAAFVNEKNNIIDDEILKTLAYLSGMTLARRYTEDKLLLNEEQLRQAMKMQAIGRLAGGIAHDYNNTLQAILGYAEIADMLTEKDSKLSEYIKEIQKAGNHSVELTKQLLAFARKQPVRRSNIDINETITGMINMFKRLVGEDIELIWNPGNNLDMILIDPSQLNQVLMNLVVNSRDAINGKGKIVIETKNAYMDNAYCEKHDGFVASKYLLLSVSDNGCGMTPEQKEHIFEPFFTTKDLDKGIGLGLASVYGIVQQNKGLINVYSEVNIGTTFNIYFAVDAVNDFVESEITVADSVEIQTGNETILIVEDDTVQLKYLEELLNQLGYKVISAQSAQEAMDLLQSNKYQIDLLIADVVMTGMSTQELLKYLRNIYPAIKCIYVSGYTSDIAKENGVFSEESIDELKTGNEVSFLQKPFNIQTISDKIRKLLKK